MISNLKIFFTAPVFEDQEKTHRAYLLHSIVRTLIFIPLLYLLYTIIMTPHEISRAIVQVIFAEIINFTLLYLIQNGQIKVASYLHVISFWFLITGTAATSSGVSDEAYFLGYPLVIIITGILLGARISSFVTILSIIAGGYMVYAEKIGALVNTGAGSSESLWVLTAIIFPLLVVLQHLSSHTIQVALQHARASEDKYRLVSSLSSDYIYETVIDDHGINKMNWVGGAFEKITGYTYEEYVATGGWLGHIHPEDVEKDAQDLAALSRNERIKSDIRTITKNGEIHWSRISALPVWDQKTNKMTGIIGSVQDVTEIKMAEEAEKESLQHQASMVQNIPDMAWLKDRNSRYLAVNEKFAMTAGRKIEEIIGKTDYDLWDENFAKAYREDDAFVIQSQKLRRIEEKQRDSLGNEGWVETIKTPIFNSAGAVIGTTGIARDITERKEVESKQQKRRELLEKIIALGKIVTERDNLRETIKKIWNGIHHELEFDRQVIFLYNFDTNMMDDTYGTDNNGQMVDNWHLSFPIEAESTFEKLLEKPDGFYFSSNYDQEDDNIDENHDMYGVKHFVAVAAWSGEKPVAVICADTLITQRPISDEQLEALRLFAGYAGLAIENSRLYEAVQNELNQQKLAEERERDRRAILEKVVKLGQSVTEVNDLRTTLKIIWHGVHDDLGFDRVATFLYNSDQVSMDGTFGTNNKGEMTDEWNIKYFINDINNLGTLPFRRVLENPDSIYLTRDFETDYGITSPDSIMYGVKDFASIPAWAGDKPVAFISVDNKITGRPITDAQLEGLRLFAGYAGLGIENSRLNSALQSELAQRKNFIEELESKNGELERFTYTVSHDLKSPLVTINGFLGYVEKDARAGDFEKLQNNLHRIRMAVDKMQLLLKDLLELSRIGRLINTPVEIPFNNIVKDAVEILQGQIRESGAAIEYHESDVIVKGDHIRLVEVLQNLLENAIKFMGDQPIPHIQVGSLVNGLQQPIFYVKDNGIGIAPEYHEKIFGLFNKLESDSTGTGIGLALVKRIIEVHGGRIWIESKVGEGTTFYFTLQQPQKES
ncbi:MAG: PAS domain S-box protein [Anaerolineales bacterium]|nr:PAS domain S-box protein [Anaerolineales bacterium]